MVPHWREHAWYLKDSLAIRKELEEVFGPQCCLATGGDKAISRGESEICGGMEPPNWQNVVAQELQAMETTLAIGKAAESKGEQKK